jgi:polysaccharide pyruvyl transferase WcaK-like protein
VPILVVGFYNKNNVGDELFIRAFKILFPKYEFIFTDLITKQNLENIDFVIFGGGSFLIDEPFVSKDAYESLYTKTILYIGVGVEDKINDKHFKLLQKAALVAIRSNNLNKVIHINKNAFEVPDIVFTLASKFNSTIQTNKSVLILPNISVVPNHKEPHWMHSNWQHFKTEFAQFLDCIVEEGYKLSFAGMSHNNKFNDEYAAAEIINHMVYHNDYIIKYDDIFDLISRYDVVITQRYHGAVISELLNKQYLTIHHHDKLKSIYLNYGNFISFYNLSKDSLLNSFYNLKSNNTRIKSDSFNELKYKVWRVIGDQV